MEFRWDAKKDRRNQRKHGISFREAATVFEDPLSATYPDPDHSLDEERFLTIGMSANRGPQQAPMLRLLGWLDVS